MPLVALGLTSFLATDGQPKIHSQGQSWYEAPGCHHVRSENAGDEEAVFVANMIVDNEVLDGAVTEIDVIMRVVVLDAVAEGRE